MSTFVRTYANESNRCLLGRWRTATGFDQRSQLFLSQWSQGCLCFLEYKFLIECPSGRVSISFLLLAHLWWVRHLAKKLRSSFRLATRALSLRSNFYLRNWILAESPFPCFHDSRSKILFHSSLVPYFFWSWPQTSRLFVACECWEKLPWCSHWTGWSPCTAGNNPLSFQKDFKFFLINFFLFTNDGFLGSILIVSKFLESLVLKSQSWKPRAFSIFKC